MRGGEGDGGGEVGDAGEVGEGDGGGGGGGPGCDIKCSLAFGRPLASETTARSSSALTTSETSVRGHVEGHAGRSFAESFCFSDSTEFVRTRMGFSICEDAK